MVSARAAAAAGAGVLAAGLGAALWWRRNPSPCPYAQRLWVELPHPSITRARLLEVLAPATGERVLEVGPGTGYYTLPVARALQDGGRLDLVDVQQEMLDHTMGRVGEAGLSNVFPVRADARALPFEDGAFDAAFLVATLGEVPSVDRAVTELVRVLRPGGRLVVGETYLDPHAVRTGRLEQAARAAGLSGDGRSAGLVGYFARFVAAGG